MEKIVTIDGKDVKLKSTAGTPRRFKAQFRRDYFAELIKLSKSFESLDTENPAEMSYEDINHLDLDVMYDIIWVLAKTADSSIPEPQAWLDSFDTFPLIDIINESQDLIMSSIQTTKK